MKYWWQRLGLIKVLTGIGGAIIHNMRSFITGEPYSDIAVIALIYLIFSGAIMFTYGDDV